MSSTNITTVRTIGKAVRMTESVVPQIVATLPEGFDPNKRGAVAEAVHSWACGNETRPAVTTGAKGAQEKTDYGRGVDALVKAVKRALSGDNPDKPVVLRATLSGEGGGSVTIPEDSDLYAAIVAMIREGQEA